MSSSNHDEVDLLKIVHSRAAVHDVEPSTLQKKSLEDGRKEQETTVALGSLNNKQMTVGVAAAIPKEKAINPDRLLEYATDAQIKQDCLDAPD